MEKQAKFKTSTRTQTLLLRQIKAKHKEILAHNNERESLQSQERFHAANDERAQAEVEAGHLIKFLYAAEELGMNNPDFPIVHDLTRIYITEPRYQLARASGHGQH